MTKSKNTFIQQAFINYYEPGTRLGKQGDPDPVLKKLTLQIKQTAFNTI